MIMCINQPLKVTKEKDGYSLSITGVLHLYRVTLEKTPTSRFYFSYERGYLFVLNSDDKMVLRGEIPSKECLKNDCIISTWTVYNPPHMKSFCY